MSEEYPPIGLMVQMQRPDGLMFMTCLDAAIDTPSLIREFDRLYGSELMTRQKLSPIERMIDEACGKKEVDMKRFLEFVYDAVFLRCPEITKAGAK